jgi:hypothetical protein
MRRLYIAGNLPEAYLIVYMLEADGILAQVFNENAQGGVGELPFTHAYPEVWVEDGAYERAREIVDNYERPRQPQQSWLCPNCAEKNPESFDVCWQCGASPA